jgi:hypothetical protein
MRSAAAKAEAENRSGSKRAPNTVSEKHSRTATPHLIALRQSLKSYGIRQFEAL